MARRPILTGMFVSVILPILLLGGLSILVPRGIERMMPENLFGIFGTGLLSTFALWLLSAGLFAALYLFQEVRIFTLLGETPTAGVGHFLRLGANAALIWGPILILVVMTSPRRWKTEVW